MHLFLLLSDYEIGFATFYTRQAARFPDYRDLFTLLATDEYGHSLTFAKLAGKKTGRLTWWHREGRQQGYTPQDYSGQCSDRSWQSYPWQKFYFGKKIGDLTLDEALLSAAAGEIAETILYTFLAMAAPQIKLIRNSEGHHSKQLILFLRRRRILFLLPLWLGKIAIAYTILIFNLHKLRGRYGRY